MSAAWWPRKGVSGRGQEEEYLEFQADFVVTGPLGTAALDYSGLILLWDIGTA